jgi:hypothetical protein
MALAAMLYAVGPAAQAQDDGPLARCRCSGAPPPTLTSLSPHSAAHGGPGFALTVNGANLFNGLVARWNGAAQPTTFLSSGQLTVTIPASDIAKAGSASVTATYGDLSTNALTFTIN